MRPRISGDGFMPGMQDRVAATIAARMRSTSLRSGGGKAWESRESRESIWCAAWWEFMAVLS
jgi:hypothetical protein